MKKFWVTQHARERYIERILNGMMPFDGDLNVIMITKANQGQDITSKLYDECPRYILFLYEKYNELGLSIIKSGEVIFIVKKRKGAYFLHDIVTCYLDNGKLFKQFKETVLTREQIFLKIKEAKRTLKA